MTQITLDVRTSFFPKDLSKLKLKLQLKGFHVEEVLETKKFLWYRKLTRFLQVSTRNLAAHFYSTRGYLTSSDCNRASEDNELTETFYREYNFLGFNCELEEKEHPY